MASSALNPIPLNPARMGRKPLDLQEARNTKPTQVRLTAELRARIEAAAGPNRMAVFIREAIEEKLERAEKAAKAKRSD